MTGPLRVVVVTPGFAPEQGGVEAHAGHLVRELVALGAHVEVLTARRGLRRARTETRDGVRVRVFPAWRIAAMSVSPRLALCGLLAFRGADIVHVHSYHALCGVSALAGLAGPVVFTPHYHGHGHSRGATVLHRGYRFVGRALFRAPSAVVCVSRAERDAVVGDFPAAVGRIHVIPNGVDAPALRAARPFPTEPPTVVSLGRLEPYKGVADLIEAVPALPAGTQVVVIGDGSQRAGLETLAGDLGVAGRVRFLGTLPTADVHRWLRTAAVLVSLSRHEAFGLAPVEAAVAGARVVLSDIPAHREIHAEYLADVGRLVPPGPGNVAAAVAAQLTATRAGTGVEAADWARITAMTLDLYRTVLAARRRSTP